MQLANSFTVGLPVPGAWDVLVDLERLAPYLPGAELHEVDGEEYRGVVKLELGAITTQFEGAARLTEVDRDSGRIVLRAEGRDTRGQGKARVTVTARLRPDGTGARVDIDTDLAITGKVAQFGRGVMAGVSRRLLAEFVAGLEADLVGARAAVDPAPTMPTAAPEPAIRAVGAGARRPVEPVSVAGGSLAAQVTTLAVVAVIVAVTRRGRRLLALAAVGAGVVAVATRT